MFKERYFSAQHDFSTAFFCKILFYIGVIFLIVFLVPVSLSFIIGSNNSGFLNQIYEFGISQIPYSFLALSIILFATSFILFFLHTQLKNLSKISEEIEYLQDLEEEIGKAKKEIKKLESRIVKLEKRK